MRLWPLIFNHLSVETAGSRRALELGNRGMRRVKTAVGTNGMTAPEAWHRSSHPA